MHDSDWSEEVAEWKTIGSALQLAACCSSRLSFTAYKLPAFRSCSRVLVRHDD